MVQREYGKEHPGIRAGIFTIRLPFIHYRWEMPEFIQALIMCAACLGIIPIMQDQLGVSFNVAWDMCIVNGIMYTMHSVLGDPVIPGWITPSLPLTYLFLSAYPIGPERIQALIALQLVLGAMFIILGVTGLAGKVVNIVPKSIKAAVLIGASIGAVIGEFGQSPGRMNTMPISLGVCGLLAYFTLYSNTFKEWGKRNKLVYKIANLGMLPAILVGLILGPIVGELPMPQIEIGTFIRIPEFGTMFKTLSPFSIGWPKPQMWIAAIPQAFATYIIAFGDLLTVESVLLDAGKHRPDEEIPYNVNRSNIVSGIRNIFMGLFCCHAGFCGPLWGATTVSVGERYKNGPKAMQSIFSGYGTFRFSTMIAVALIPIVTLVRPALGLSIGISLLVQGFICLRLGVDMCKDDLDISIASVAGCALAVKGAAYGLAVGIILFFIIKSKTDIRNEYKGVKSKAV